MSSTMKSKFPHLVVESDGGSDCESVQSAIREHDAQEQDTEIEIPIQEAEIPIQTTSSKKLGTFQSFLEIIWDDEKTMVTLKQFLVQAGKKALSDRMYSFKKKIYAFQKVAEKASEILAAKNLSPKCSLARFKRLFQGEEYYTIYTRETLTELEMDCLVDVWESHIQEQCSSSVATETTTTSSTIVATAQAPVDAQGCKRSKTEITYDSDEDLFAPTNLQFNTGGISQSIAKRVNGQWITFTSPGERGLNIVKVDVIPFAEAVTMEKSCWWKIATTRLLFITSSIADKKQMRTDELIAMANKDLKKLNLKMDVKGTESKYSFKNTQHPL